MGEYFPNEIARFKDGKLSPRKGGRKDATWERKCRYQGNIFEEKRQLKYLINHAA